MVNQAFTCLYMYIQSLLLLVDFTHNTFFQSYIHYYYIYVIHVLCMCVPFPIHCSLLPLCKGIGEGATVFVDSVSHLIGLLLDYRNVQGDSSCQGQRMGCMFNLLVSCYAVLFLAMSLVVCLLIVSEFL